MREVTSIRGRALVALLAVGCAVYGGPGTGGSGTIDYQSDTESCFSPDGREVFADASGEALAELATTYTPTREEVLLATVYWAAVIDGAESGQIQPWLGDAGLYDAMFALGAKYPDIAETQAACAGDGVMDRAGKMYPCEPDCRSQANRELEKAIPLELFELTIGKYGWALDLTKDVTALNKARAVLSAIQTAILAGKTLSEAIMAAQGDIDALTDLAVMLILARAEGAANTAAQLGGLLVASAAWSIYTLYRDYNEDQAACATYQAANCMPTGTSGGTGGPGMPGDPCAVSEECVPGAICFNQTCVGQGMLRISLAWSEATDLDLHVRTPDFTEINFSAPAGAGGELDVDQCAGDCTPGSHVENVTFAQTPASGTYEVWVVNFDGAAAATYSIEVSGVAMKAWSGSLPMVEGKSSMVYSFSVGM